MRIFATALVLAALLFPGMGWAAVALVASATAGSSDTNSVTTTAANNTGANFLVCAAAYGTGSTMSMSDSSSNTWSALTLGFSNFSELRLYYVANATVSNSQTYTISGTASYPSLACKSFSGVKTASPFDQQNTNNSATASVATLTTGSITPGFDNELLIAGISFDAGVTSLNIDSSFIGISETPHSAGAHYGVAIAYQIQTTATTRNPAWAWTTNVAVATAIASFQEGAGAAAPTFYGRRVQ